MRKTGASQRISDAGLLGAALGAVPTSVPRAFLACVSLGVSLVKTARPHRPPLCQGVSTTLVAALADDVQPGGYYVDCRLETAAVHPLADDADLARRLWERSDAAVAPFVGPAAAVDAKGESA